MQISVPIPSAGSGSSILEGELVPPPGFRQDAPAPPFVELQEEVRQYIERQDARKKLGMNPSLWHQGN